MLASKFQARWRTCPPIFGHSEFCVRRISRLLFRHDSIVIAYTRIFCKVPSSAWSSKKTKNIFATHREYTSRWIESRNFCINKSNYSMTKSISQLGIFGKVAFYFVRKKMMCVSWCTDFYSPKLVKSSYKIWWHNEPAFFKHYECINTLVTLPFYSIFVLHWGRLTLMLLLLSNNDAQLVDQHILRELLQ